MVDGAVHWQEFAARDELAAALADRLAGVLQRAIKQRGKALLAVSGGTTPTGLFKALSRKALDWTKIAITLVDERFVDESSPRSNAGLVKAMLLQDNAAAARFVGLRGSAASVEQAALDAETALRRLGLPLDAAVLGMGGDGHTASFFPDAENLTNLLDPAWPVLVSPVHAPSGVEPRLTLTLPPLVAAGFLALHIEGEEKKAVLDAVLSGRSLPVGVVIGHAQHPIDVYWAP